jgi:hypothetical protein
MFLRLLQSVNVQKAFDSGLDDCWIEPLALDARFLFSNDRDVHVTSHSIELLDSIRARWRTKGFICIQMTSEKMPNGSAPAKRTKLQCGEFGG